MNLFLMWLVSSLIIFLFISSVMRKRKECISIWDGYIWGGIIIISMIFPLGIIFGICILLEDHNIWNGLIKERRRKS